MQPYPNVEGYDRFIEVRKIISNADIVVGVPSYNSAHTIAYVVHNAAIGLQRYYENYNSIIIVCDGLSDDPTVDVVRSIRKHYKIPIVIVPNVRAPGKGAAIRTIIELVVKYSGAKALVLVDSDLRSIHPIWIKLLCKGAMEYGFTAPLYRRHRFDATITNFVARPMTTMVYGVDLRQPIGGEFGLGRKLMEILCDNVLWTSNPWTQLFGVDIFITHTALANNIPVCEAVLGAKIHEPKDPSVSLRSMFIEVVGSLFMVIAEYYSSWSRFKPQTIKKPRRIEDPELPYMAPWEVKIDIELLKESFIKGISCYKTIYERIFPTPIMEKLYSNMVRRNGVDKDLWSDVLLHSLSSYIKACSMSDKISILRSLMPLWQGRLYNYALTVDNLTDEEVEHVLEDEIALFFSKRHILEELMEK